MNLAVYLKKTLTTANLNVPLSGGGRSKLGLASDGVKFTYYQRHHLLFLFYRENLGEHWGDSLKSNTITS